MEEPVNNTELKHLSFDSIHILEWHDGIVRAIGTGQERTYLLFLVAWDLKSGSRAYLLLQLPPNIANEIMLSISEGQEGSQMDKWNRFNRLFDDFVANYRESVYLLLQEPVVGKDLPLRIRNKEDLKVLGTYNIEMVFRPEALTCWLGSD